MLQMCLVSPACGVLFFLKWGGSMTPDFGLSTVSLLGEIRPESRSILPCGGGITSKDGLLPIWHVLNTENGI